MSAASVGLYACAQSPAGQAPAASPFADKTVLSYSDSTDPVTKQKYVIRWGDLKPKDFGPRSVAYDDAGLRAVPHVPPPGVHPRIWFGPDDLPALRERMKQGIAGPMMWSKVIAWSNALKGTYNESAPYAKPDLWKGDYRGSHGNIRLWYYHDATSPFNPNNRTYERLVQGDLSIDPAPLWPVFAIEAYRALIEDDQAGGQMLAKAVMTAMRHDQMARDRERAAKNQTGPLPAPVSGGAGGQELGYIYDFDFNFMTPEQKKAVHDELAAATWAHDNYGTFNAAVSTRSNWATFTYWLIPLLAIEGEPGYNELKTLGIYRGYRNFLTYGIFPSGAVVEAEAKDQLGADGLFAMARRLQPDLFGHPNLRAYAMRFLPHSIVPNLDYRTPVSDFQAGPFLRYDLLGGMGYPLQSDIVILKYMFPHDRVIDWVYRADVGEHYENLPQGGNTGYWDELMLCTIFATDFDPSNGDPAKLGLGPDFFSGERALMLARSDWGRDALMLNMHTRELNGGHPFADRNSIFLFAEGRDWVPLNQRDGDDVVQSEVVIDKHPQSVNSPGRVVEYAESPQATFMVGDASYAWDWDLQILQYSGGYTLDEVRSGKVQLKPGQEPERHSMNDFAYTKLPDAYMNAPLFELPGWISKDGLLTPMVRSQNYPVKKAFRTAGLVRGPHPYGLVIDDIQKDDAVHHYDWDLLLENDLAIVEMKQDNGVDGPVYDVTLAGAEGPFKTSGNPKAPIPSAPKSLGAVKKGEPLLLIRVMQCNVAASATRTPPAILTNVDKKKPLLDIQSDSVSPDYKVLLLPYRKGEAPPTTVWNKEHTAITVDFGSYQDTIALTPAPSGKTDFTITRNQQGVRTEIVAVKKPVPPLPEPAK